jgi:hypothetical protein
VEWIRFSYDGIVAEENIACVENADAPDLH